MFTLFVGVLFYTFNIDNYLDYFVIDQTLSYIERTDSIDLDGLTSDFQIVKIHIYGKNDCSFCVPC